MRNKHLFLLLLAAFFAPLAMNAQNTLTVHDGTETTDRVPIFSWHAIVSQQSQLIYPASELAAMSGKVLTQMVFYWQQDPWTSDSYSVGTWTISLGETTATAFNGGFDTTTSLTEVFTGVLDEAGGLFNTDDHTLTITFDEEYAYQGGNLLIQFAHTGTGEQMDYHFIGQSMNEATSYLCCYESNGTAYIDESNNFLPKTTFTYQAQPNCAKPTNVAVSINESESTATVTWTSEATNFNIDVNGVITAVTGNSYTFNVSQITTYTIKVQAVCGDDQSFWTKAISFFSGCGIFPVTYSYGFEDERDINCWTIITTGYNSEDTGIYEDEDDEDYAHTGSHSFRFYYTTEPGQYLISPELGGFGNGLRVKFWYLEEDEYYTETFQVGYSTTDNDPDSFTWGDEITATTSYQQFKANYPAATKYVAVKHTSDDQWNLYFDDFLFEESPSCLEPTGVQVADVTTNSATISWTAGGSQTAWDIFVTADATIVPDDNTTPTVANTNNNSYSLSNLSAGTIYYVYVRAICSGTEVSEWSNAAIFHTECGAVALPYYENFNAGLPVCWSIIFDMSNSNIVTQPKTSPTDPDKILMFIRNNDPNYAFAVLPEIDENYPLNRYQMSFDACYYYFETNVKLSIGIMTDPADSTTFVPIDEVDIIDSYDYSASDLGFGTYTVYFNNYSGNGRYIAIRDNNINSNGYVLIDNIAVSELPSCLSPTGLTANAASTSAELSWTANNGESSWTLYWKESGAEAYTEVPNVTENSYTLSNLSAATAYQFCVVAHCDETDHSDPSAVYTFTTNCGPVALPWSEDFEGLAGEGLPLCWNTIIDNTSACHIGSTNINNNNVLVISMNQSSSPYSAAVVLPEVDADYPLNQCQISFDAGFWCSNSSTTGKNLGIYILDDPNNPEAGVEVCYASITDDYSNLGRYTVLFNNYEGSGHYIALVCLGTFGLQGGEQDSYAVFIDNIEVSTIPSCLSPTNLTANAASTSAELSWTANNDESSWSLYWKESGAEAYTEVPNLTENSYTLNNLTANTAYQFYVVAHCDETDHSAPSAVYTFTTNCDPITLPWSEDFEGLAGEGLLPVCWNTIADNPSACYIGSTNINNNNVLVINMNQSSTPYSAAVVLPEVDASYPLNQCQISFDAGYWSSNSSTTGEQLIVFIMSDPNDLQTAEMIGFVAITDAYPNIGRHTVRFNDYEGNGQYITLVCTGGGSFGGSDPYAVFIDNIEVSPLPSCMPPANLAATNITGSSAQLAWTANGQSAWDIYVTNDATDVPDDDTTPTVANTEDNPYSLTELNSLTTYYVYVRTICGENEVSEWSNRASFTTKCATTTVDADNPYTQDFNDETFPPDCWELGGDPFSNWYRTVQGYAYTEYNPNYLYMPFLHIDANNAVLTFKTKERDIEYYTGGSENDGGLSIVKVSTNGGGTWTQLWCPTIDELTTDFRTVTLSLYDYVGQDILIAFEHQGHHGWIIDDVEVKAEQLATFTKTIEGYGEDGGGWYLIASPVLSVTPTADNGFITDDFGGDIPEGESASYDLYYFDQTGGTNGKEWKNYRAHHNDATYPFNALVNGKGYLYASKNGTELTFAGTLYSGDAQVALVYSESNPNEDMRGWNLVGNPFGETANLPSGLSYYTLNDLRSELTSGSATTIEAMEAIFVQATATGQSVQFTKQSRDTESNPNAILTLNLTDNRDRLIDRAIVRFDEGQTLPKFQIHENSTKVYIPQDGKDYAVVSVGRDAARHVSTMPVNFKAETDGTYTITVNVDNVEMAYLHLIDNMTGADVDLLTSPNYTFTAKTTDYESRFKLVFSADEDVCEPNEAFAFISNGNIIVNGTGTLQVIDMTGRFIVQGDAINRVSTDGMTAGVYVLRLINGENVRIQKIVVE